MRFTGKYMNLRRRAAEILMRRQVSRDGRTNGNERAPREETECEESGYAF